MSRFAPALRRAARELDLPRTVRSAILAELAADLEAVFEHHRAQGLGMEEASRRAVEQVLGSAEMIGRLSRLHRGSWREWSEGIGARLAGGVDLILLAFGVVPVLVMAGVVALDAFATGPASPLVWPLSAIGTLLAAVVPTELIRLLRGNAARPHRLRLFFGLAAIAPALGLLALVHGAYDVATTLGTTPATTVIAGLPSSDLAGEGTAVGHTQRLVALIVLRDGAALLIALLLAIAGGLSWFVLLNRSAEQVAREVDRILEGRPEAGPRPMGGDGEKWCDTPAGQWPAPEARVIPLARGRRA